MNFNAPNYKEHQEEYFNQKLFKKNISLFFIYENCTLSIDLDFYIKLMRSYLFIIR